MARNEEKHSGRLNRLWLQRLDEENAEKNPPRPGLGSLHTAEQVKKWMPGIKKDIDFYLKQSQVGCYPERKISEFSEKIEALTKEYKAYLRKYRELEGDKDSTPWSDQPYSRKHKASRELATDKGEEPPKKLAESSESMKKKEKASFVPVSLPVLDRNDDYQNIYTYSIVSTEVPAVNDVDVDTNNQPLEFHWNKNVKALDPGTDVIKKSLKDSLVSGIQNKPLAFQWRKADMSPDRCCRCSSDGSGECSKNLCKCSKNFCNCPNYDGCLDSMRIYSSCDRCSNSTQQQSESTKSCTGGVIVSNSNTACVPDNVTKDRTMNEDIGNILHLPYSDSSSDENS